MKESGGHFGVHDRFGSCVTSIAGPNGMRNCTRDEGRSFEVGNRVLILSHRKLLSSVRWPIACAMQHGLLLWVNSLHYRAAASLSASPQLAELIRAAKRFRVVPGADICTCSKFGKIPRQRERASVDDKGQDWANIARDGPDQFVGTSASGILMPISR
jgi:hypothetical protein